MLSKGVCKSLFVMDLLLIHQDNILLQEFLLESKSPPPKHFLCKAGLTSIGFCFKWVLPVFLVLCSQAREETHGYYLKEEEVISMFSSSSIVFRSRNLVTTGVNDLPKVSG